MAIDTSTAKRSKAARMRLLSETEPGTLMGRLMRSFWQPIARLEDVPVGSARALRILGEDLTLYRGESGVPYLVGGRCAHRCTVLHTGWVQGEQIRCMYHGWRYDGSGHCTEMPAERKPIAGSIKIAGYPIRDYCGLLFAYLGEEPVPEFQLPRKDELEATDRHIIVTPPTIWDTNWLQSVENSLDAAHVSFVHNWGKVERFGAEVSTEIPQLEYTETSAGMRQIATRGRGNVRVSDWTFPNNNHIIVPARGADDPWVDIFAWVVPIDDDTSLRFSLISFPRSDDATNARVVEEHTTAFNPADHYVELFVEHRLPEVTGVRFIAVQDYVAQRGQGRIADRVNERLASSDAGIAMLRKIFWREMDALKAGRPFKHWTKLEHPVELPTPVRATR